MNVLIVGQNQTNFGDEAAGIACAQILLEEEKINRVGIIYRARNLKFTPLNIKNSKLYNCGQFGLTISRIYARILCSIIFVFPIKKFMNLNDEVRNYVALLETYNCVIVGPMGADIGKYKNWKLLLEILIATKKNKKVVFYLDTINKSGDIIFDLIAKYILQRSNVFVREKASKKYLQESGINAKLGIDTAFRLKNLTLKDIKEKPYITVVMSENIFDWHPDYKKVNINSHSFLKEQLLLPILKIANFYKLRVRVINHTTVQEENQRQIELISEINNNLKNDNKINYLYVNNAFEYEKAIAESKFVVSMRYHGIVLAAKNNVPFLAISYENKMDEVCRYTNCSECCKNLMSLVNGKIKIDKELDILIKNRLLLKNKISMFQNSKLQKTVYLPLEAIISDEK